MKDRRSTDRPLDIPFEAPWGAGQRPLKDDETIDTTVTTAAIDRVQQHIDRLTEASPVLNDVAAFAIWHESLVPYLPRIAALN